MSARRTTKPRREHIIAPEFNELHAAGVRHFDETIHDQSKEWLAENFAAGSSKFPVNVTKLVRNIIWQQRERVVAKQREPIAELIRTFWYMYIKPTLSRAGALSNESDQYSELVNQLVYLVRDAKLMSYAEVGFRDDGEANRQSGINAHVILFSEKVGHAGFLKEMADRYQISTIALGGQPSVLTVEYFVRDLRERGVDLRRSFYLFSIVDYDTSGGIIRDSFVKNLRAFGIKNIKVVDLVNPDMLSPAEVEAAKFRIPEDRSSAPKNTDWLRTVHAAGYVNQTILDPDTKAKNRVLYGIESEAISSKRLSDKIAELVPGLLGKSERLFRLAHLEKIIKALDTLALVALKRDRTERR